MSHVYCPECGFQSPEAANYCARCGALLARDEPARPRSASAPRRSAARRRSSVEGRRGPALVVRSGGGRAGESFQPTATGR